MFKKMLFVSACLLTGTFMLYGACNSTCCKNDTCCPEECCCKIDSLCDKDDCCCTNNFCCLAEKGSLNAKDIKDPVKHLHAWLNEAKKLHPHDYDHVALATSTPEGKPHLKMIVTMVEKNGDLMFFTHKDSTKSKMLEKTITSRHFSIGLNKTGKSLFVEKQKTLKIKKLKDFFWI
jgi:hypothetical protein